MNNLKNAIVLVLLFLFWSLHINAQNANEFNEKEFGKIFQHKFATVNNAKLHYVVGGKGEAVVLIHGYPLTWYEWRKIMPALAEKYTVIAPDSRGLGNSEVTKTGYDKRNVAEDVHQLLESLGVKKFNLVSHDMGGPVAYALANAYPETVAKFAIMESGIPGFGLEKAMDVASGGAWHFGLYMSEYAEILTEGREREFFTKYDYDKENKYRPGSINQTDIDVYIKNYTKQGGMTAGFNHYRTLLDDAKYNKANFRGKLKIPILVIGAEKSFGKFTFESMSNVAENVRGAMIQNCGHFVPEEQPEELTKLLLQFFDEQPGREK